MVRSLARGDYFMWHADDDSLGPEYIAECVRHLEADASLALVSGIPVYRDPSGKITHSGNILRLEAVSPILRVIRYLWRVEDNGIFYGIYRMKYVKDAKFTKGFPSDWIWVADFLLTGKARMISNAQIVRDYGNSVSSSPDGYKSIIALLGLPSWYARLPWLAKGLNSGTHFLFQSSVTRVFPVWKRISIAVLVALTLWIRGGYLHLRLLLSRIGPLRRLYFKLQGRNANITRLTKPTLHSNPAGEEKASGSEAHDFSK
jgi:hypothetical protein